MWISVEPYGVVYTDENEPTRDEAWYVSNPIDCQSGVGELSFLLVQPHSSFALSHVLIQIKI